QVDPAGLKQVYDSLGGDHAWQALLNFSPGTKVTMESFRSMRANVPDVEAQVLRQKIDELRTWQTFQNEGGVAEFVRLGLPLEREVPGISKCLPYLRWHTAQEAAEQDVEQMRDADIATRQDLEIRRLLALAKKEYDTLHSLAQKGFEAKAQAIRAQ